MKTKFLSLLAVAFGLMMASCEPTEHRNVLENTFNPEDIEFTVEQSAGGTGNAITLTMDTPGVMGYWDYNIGTTLGPKTSFTYPMTGEATFTFVVTNKYINEDKTTEYIKKSVTLNIAEIDTRPAQQFYDIAGDDLKGKTWVFAGTVGDKGKWWRQSPPNAPAKYMNFWGFNPGGDCAPEDYPNADLPDDLMGEMEFNFDGGANLLNYATAGGEARPNTFVLSPDFTMLTTSGETSILGGKWDAKGLYPTEYYVTKLTATELHIYNGKHCNGNGWTWIFKAKE